MNAENLAPTGIFFILVFPLCLLSLLYSTHNPNIHAAAGFEPAIPASRRPQTLALDRSGIRSPDHPAHRQSLYRPTVKFGNTMQTVITKSGVHPESLPSALHGITDTEFGLRLMKSKIQGNVQGGHTKRAEFGAWHTDCKHASYLSVCKT